MTLSAVRRRHASVGQVAAPSTFTANSSAPGPLKPARRPGPLLRGDVVCCDVPVAVDHPLHVSGNRHFHLRSCCNECSIKGEEEEGELLLLLLIHAPAHRLFVYRRTRMG